MRARFRDSNLLHYYIALHMVIYINIRFNLDRLAKDGQIFSPLAKFEVHRYKLESDRKLDSDHIYGYIIVQTAVSV